MFTKKSLKLEIAYRGEKFIFEIALMQKEEDEDE